MPVRHKAAEKDHEIGRQKKIKEVFYPAEQAAFFRKYQVNRLAVRLPSRTARSQELLEQNPGVGGYTSTCRRELATTSEVRHLLSHP